MIPLLAITLVSTTLAIMMSVVAWRASREERRRSDARIRALSADIHGAPIDDVDLMLQPQLSTIQGATIRGEAAELFASTRRSVGSSHWGLALVAGVLVIAAAAAIAVIFSGESRTASVGAATSAARTAGPQVNMVPLELVALGHDRDGDQLTVRGMVVNPAGGAQVNRLTAVVFGFNRDGEFLASGQSAIASPTLLPGDRSSFVVSLPGAGDVVRYRVSFRSDDRVVPHADRRAKS